MRRIAHEAAEIGAVIRARFQKNARGKWVGECFDEAGATEFVIYADTEAGARTELAARAFEEAAKSIRAAGVEGGIVWHTCGKHELPPDTRVRFERIQVAVVEAGVVAFEVGGRGGPLFGFSPDDAEGIAKELGNAATVARLPQSQISALHKQQRGGVTQ